MGNNPRIDRDILIPIGVSVFSMIGLCMVLAIAFEQNNRMVPRMTPTTALRNSQPRENRSSHPELSTPTQETELTTTPQEPVDLEATSNPVLPPTVSVQPSATISSPAANLQNTSTPVSSILSPPAVSSPTAIGPTANKSITATLTAEPTVDASEVFLAGKYDDPDNRIEYEGDWMGDLFVDGAYEETISSSTTIGDTASFTFVGNQIELGYLGDSDLGTAFISIDGIAYPPINQAIGSTWSSPQLASGQHSVVIRHQAGDLICVDYINVRG